MEISFSAIEGLKKEFDQILKKPSAKEMKMGCDHQSDCLKMIQLILDGEATEQQIEKLRNNLHTCKPCIEMYHLEDTIKKLLKDIKPPPCPPALSDKIKSLI